MADITVKVAKLSDELKDLMHAYDPENAHVRADEILCELLELLGYKDFVEMFAEVPRWYA